MSKSELFLQLAAIPDGDPRLKAIEHALDGKAESPTQPVSLRLFRMGEAASETGLSRSTLWRAVRDQRLRAVEVRRGSFRIPESELIRFVQGKEDGK